MFNNKVIAFSALFTYLLLTTNSICSAVVKKTTPTPTLEVSPTLEATDSASTTQTLKERIEKVVDEKKEQIQGTIQDLSKNRKGIIGQVTRVSEETITYINEKGTSILPIDPGVIIIKKNKRIKVKDVAVDDWLIILGYLEEDSFTPKKILVQTKSLAFDEQLVYLGNIKSVSGSGITIVPRNLEEEISLNVNKKTAITDYEGQDIAAKLLKDNLQALVVGTKDKQDQKTAVIIRALAALE